MYPAELDTKMRQHELVREAERHQLAQFVQNRAEKPSFWQRVRAHIHLNAGAPSELPCQQETMQQVNMTRIALW